MRLGYKLMSEEFGPADLLTQAVRAESAGFDIAAISDHYFPWLEEQGHSPFIWSVLGGIAVNTERIELMTSVTCPTFRYHPAVIAQAAATVALMSDSRFRLGLGSGERLNEHVIGGGWPSVPVRQDRLEEAIDIIRLLLDGESGSYRGEHFELSDAQLFDLPEDPPEILVAAGGPIAARIAGAKGDGLIATEPRRDLVMAYREAGGRGACCAEIALCWSRQKRDALETMHRYARWGELDWNVLPELPHPRAFDAASRSVQPEDLAETPHGPDVDAYIETVGSYLEAGFDELILHQIGPEQDGFCEFFETELADALREKAKQVQMQADKKQASRSHPPDAQT